MVKLDKKTRGQYTKIVLDALHEGNKEQFRNTYLELQPSDQSDIFITLDEDARSRGYSFLTSKEFAEIFGGLNVRDQKLFFLELDEIYASDMFNNMFTDDVANFLTEINSNRAEEILLQMDEEKAKKVRGILSYAHETAGAIMTKELISISSTQTATEVLEKLRNEAPDVELMFYLYVVDPRVLLVGVVSLRHLIIASRNGAIEDIMITRRVSVFDDMDEEDVGNLIKNYDSLAAPLVSKEDRLLGI